MARPPSEIDLMDKLRAVAFLIAERAARPRPTSVLSREDGERGQGLAEYALILAGIAIVAIVSMIFLGTSINGLFLAPISSEFGKILSELGIG
jgi:Flp pilus assembly pilin Flp